MKRAAASLLPALLVAAAPGCGTSRCPDLAPELRYCLQAPEAGPPISALQEVVVTRGERAETLLVHTESDGRRLAVVGMSPLGQTLVSAAWDGRTVQVLTAMPSLALDAGAMLAFAQFALLPVDGLRAGFERDLQVAGEAGATMQVRDAHGGALMKIRRDGRSPPFERIRVELPTVGFVLESRTLDESRTAPAAP